MGTRPGHVLGDVVGEYELDGEKFYRILIMGTDVRGYVMKLGLNIPAQYVVVGDELDDLYPDLEETQE